MPQTHEQDILDRLREALLERYRIEDRIGRGGMATVWLAHDLRHDRQVAIKVLHPEIAASLGPERFLREIQVAAKLNHPYVLTLIDSGEANGLLYYVMPFVSGESLRARLLRERTLDLDTAAAIARDVADALGYAHRHGVVHRDIKPENVLFSEGHALVTDFGIAKAVSQASDEPLTRTGVAVGTPGYMSPEQAAGAADIDERTDVFSLGCVVYEMLVGEVPARWVSDEETRQGRFMRAPAAHQSQLNTVPASVSRALVRAMAIDADRRFPTPDAFVQALAGGGVPARKYSDTEANEIIRQAAALQASEPTSPGMSLTGVKQIGHEVDIPSRHIAAAANALAHHGEREVPVESHRRVLGIPAGARLARTIQREIPPTEYGALLEIIQETLGEAGEIEASVGNVFAWNSGAVGWPRGRGRVTRVQVSVREGRTKISITEDRTRMVGAAAGVGAAVSGMLAMAAGRGVELPLLVAGLGVVIAAGIGSAVQLGRQRRDVLERLLDRLTLEISTSTPALPEPHQT